MQLPNPQNDALAVAAALRQLGFEVFEHMDLDKTRMDNAFITFNDAMNGAETALFFYSGYGMQLDNVNYLIPVGRLPEEIGHVRNMTVQVDDVLLSMDEKT